MFHHQKYLSSLRLSIRSTALAFLAVSVFLLPAKLSAQKRIDVLAVEDSSTTSSTSTAADMQSYFTELFASGSINFKIQIIGPFDIGVGGGLSVTDLDDAMRNGGTSIENQVKAATQALEADYLADFVIFLGGQSGPGNILGQTESSFERYAASKTGFYASILTASHELGHLLGYHSHSSKTVVPPIYTMIGDDQILVSPGQIQVHLMSSGFPTPIGDYTASQFQPFEASATLQAWNDQASANSQKRNMADVPYTEWNYVSWMGWVYRGSADWFYQDQVGWIFLMIQDIDESSLYFFYDDIASWCWTSYNSWPMYFNFETGIWTNAGD